MLDINYIRENQEKIKDSALKKNFQFNLDELISIDDSRRELLKKVELLRSERNRISKEIPEKKGDDRANLIASSKELKSELDNIESEYKNIQNKFDSLMLLVPNVLHPTIPFGKDENDNLEIRRWGNIPKFDFSPKDHLEIGEKLGIIDVERSAKIGGARSYMLKGDGALLEQAVIRLAIDVVLMNGFKLIQVPILVKDSAMFGTGFFPMGMEETYIIEKDKLNLVGTSEVSLVSIHSGEILNEEDLPIMYVGATTCFRREAGSYGKDTRGIYRVHQFQKVEQVVLCKNDPEESMKMHNFILNNSETIVQQLGLPHRVAIACSGEVGLGQVLKNEIETWMPKREKYCETHSCSSLYEFQARRSNIRYRTLDGDIKYVHTLNNTAIASPRILIPILENYQDKDGNVTIPEVLRKYMNGKEKILVQ